MKKFLYFLFVFSTMLSLRVTAGSASIKNIDSIMYDVNPDGTPGKKYTGWATKKLSDDKYYYKDGIKQKGWHTIKNQLYYFNQDGIMSKGL